MNITPIDSRRQSEIENDPRWAYLEWLRSEARLLQFELMPNAPSSADFSPVGTFARTFHSDAWSRMSEAARPSTRAVSMLTAAGVKIPASARGITK